MECGDLSRLIFDSGRSLERVVGDFAFDDFLSHVGIDPMMGDFQVGVREGPLGNDMGGWIWEDCERGCVRYVPEYQR
jgi:hypothetical protein